MNEVDANVYGYSIEYCMPKEQLTILIKFELRKICHMNRCQETGSRKGWPLKEKQQANNGLPNSYSSITLVPLLNIHNCLNAIGTSYDVRAMSVPSTSMHL